MFAGKKLGLLVRFRKEPNMQYNYVFANGEKCCVEVSAGMLAALQAEDRLERNNEQKNSRRAGRFVRLDAPGQMGSPWSP